MALYVLLQELLVYQESPSKVFMCLKTAIITPRGFLFGGITVEIKAN